MVNISLRPKVQLEPILWNKFCSKKTQIFFDSFFAVVLLHSGSNEPTCRWFMNFYFVTNTGGPRYSQFWFSADSFLSQKLRIRGFPSIIRGSKNKTFWTISAPLLSSFLVFAGLFKNITPGAVCIRSTCLFWRTSEQLLSNNVGHLLLFFISQHTSDHFNGNQPDVRD